MTDDRFRCFPYSACWWIIQWNVIGFKGPEFSIALPILALVGLFLFHTYFCLHLLLCISPVSIQVIFSHRLFNYCKKWSGPSLFFSYLRIDTCSSDEQQQLRCVWHVCWLIKGKGNAFNFSGFIFQLWHDISSNIFHQTNHSICGKTNCWEYVQISGHISFATSFWHFLIRSSSENGLLSVREYVIHSKACSCSSLILWSLFRKHGFHRWQNLLQCLKLSCTYLFGNLRIKRWMLSFIMPLNIVLF